jgi:transposase-like protein
MKKERTRYSVEIKMKVAIEAIKEQKTINEIAGQYQIHPNQVTKWKKQLLDEGKSIFEQGGKKAKQNEVPEERLYQQIGQLQVELDWLKKKSGM